jgi:hypothetical protein
MTPNNALKPDLQAGFVPLLGRLAPALAARSLDSCLIFNSWFG